VTTDPTDGEQDKDAPSATEQFKASIRAELLSGRQRRIRRAHLRMHLPDPYPDTDDDHT
jgi:hypothetical protein